MLFAARSHIGLVRQVNQDSYSIHMGEDPWQLLVVADGMGGASAGDVASKLAADTVTARVRTEMAEHPTDPAIILVHAVQAANHIIWEAAKAEPEYVGMGTTLVASLYNDERIVFAHVGDSRGYVYRGLKLRQITRDHSLVAELVRRGQLTEAEAQVHPQRNVVTRSLGTAASTDPEVDVVAWQPGDALLLCTDGLSNVVSLPELQDYVGSLTEAGTQQEVEDVADRLVRLALERGGPDNITLVLVVYREGSIR